MTNSIGYNSPYRQKYEEMERWYAAWLDKYFYPYISKNFKRNYDTDTQKQGIDLFLTGATKGISIDEKASVLWCNCGLDKYSFELSLLALDAETNKPYELNGWYLTDSISTHIAIVFIDSATTVESRQLTGSGITQATVVIIDKEKFQRKLDEMGWTKVNLKKKSDMIREAYNEYGDEYWKHINCGILSYKQPHFFVQRIPKEHGINIQFTKQFLIDNSEYAAKVTTDKIITLKK